MRKMATLLQQLKPILPLVFITVLLLTLGSLPVGTTRAQGGPEPTPTDLGHDNNDDDDDNGGGAAPARPVAGISGFVYDYTNQVYEGGVAVIFETQGWQTEAVTDSNGFYQINGLDTNGGILNLRLPPGVQAAAPDWPVRLVRGATTEVNLGYYWDDGASIPVRLTASLTGSKLLVEIDNQTSKAATGGQITIISPAIINVKPPVQASAGQVVDYDPHNFQVDVNEIDGGDTVSVNVLTEANSEVKAGPAPPEIRVVFTYDQQITPQVIIVDAAGLPNLPVASISRSPSQPAQVGEANTVILGSTAPTATADASTVTLAASGAAPTAAPTAQAETSMAKPATQTESMSSESKSEELLPVTGRFSQPVNTAALTLSVLVLLGLAVGGFWAIRGNWG
ncbi:MAG: hypothetical protein KDI79_06210 [Anaerolineae bacterium]|nr:hypothetical protein [Anaerolineae bacterium]